LDAAMKVFVREGYRGATTRKIAEEAEVNEVTLFRKFKSKDNILRAVITENRELTLQQFNSIVQREKSTEITTFLRDLGHGIMKLMEEKKMDLLILLIAEGRKKPDVAEILSIVPKTMLKRLSEYFEEQMEHGDMRSINPQVAAFTFISYIVYSNLIKGIIGDILGDDKKAFNDFIDIFTRGVVSPEHKELRKDFLEGELANKTPV